jgi:hypothetical protein
VGRALRHSTVSAAQLLLSYGCAWQSHNQWKQVTRHKTQLPCLPPDVLHRYCNEEEVLHVLRVMRRLWVHTLTTFTPDDQITLATALGAALPPPPSSSSPSTVGSTAARSTQSGNPQSRQTATSTPEAAAVRAVAWHVLQCTASAMGGCVKRHTLTVAAFVHTILLPHLFCVAPTEQPSSSKPSQGTSVPSSAGHAPSSGEARSGSASSLPPYVADTLLSLHAPDGPMPWAVNKLMSWVGPGTCTAVLCPGCHAECAA